MGRFPAAAAAAALAAAPAFAGHANPWAEADDTLLMQYHDENLEKSVDTPGEDEMRGVMVGAARGKLEDRPAGHGDGSAAGGGGRRD